MNRDESDDARPSKTQVKKAMLALQAMSEALLDLPEDRLAMLPLDERLREALADWRRIRAHGARKRQMKYVGRLLRDADIAALREALNASRADAAARTREQHQLETWRDRLLADDAGLAAWIDAHPDCDTRQFRALVAAARRERDAAEQADRRGRPARMGKSSRELFRRLRASTDGSA